MEGEQQLLALDKEKGDYNPQNRIHRDEISGVTNLSTMSYSIETSYRLQLDDLVRLADLLLPLDPPPQARRQYPSLYTRRGRYKYNNVEGLCIASKKLAFPHTWEELEDHFGRSAGALCTVFYDVCDRILERHGHLLDFVPARFVPKIPYFAGKVAAKGVPAGMHVFAFMDGTKRRVCVPDPAEEKLPPGVSQCSLSLPL